MNTGTKHITEDFSKLRRVLKNQSIRCAVFIYFHAMNKKTDETTKPISKANKLLKPAQPIEQSKKASVSCRGAEKLTNGCQKRFIMQPALWNSTLMRRFSALDRIYARIEDSQQYFKQASTQAGNPIACPRRCGTCCIHFTPDVTALEAERLALYLLVEKGTSSILFSAGSRSRKKPAKPGIPIRPAPFGTRINPARTAWSIPGGPWYADCSDTAPFLTRKGDQASPSATRCLPSPIAEKEFSPGKKPCAAFSDSVRPSWMNFPGKSWRWIPAEPESGARSSKPFPPRFRKFLSSSAWPRATATAKVRCRQRSQASAFHPRRPPPKPIRTRTISR